MTRIMVTMEVLCVDEVTANKVLAEFLPSADTMVGTAGVLGVKAEWKAESKE